MIETKSNILTREEIYIVKQCLELLLTDYFKEYTKSKLGNLNPLGKINIIYEKIRSQLE